MVSKDDFGSPSFYTPEQHSPGTTRKVLTPPSDIRQVTRRLSHYHTPSMQNKHNPTEENDQVIDERDMIMKLVRDIAMDLDVTSVSHRILQVSIIFYWGNFILLGINKKHLNNIIRWISKTSVLLI